MAPMTTRTVIWHSVKTWIFYKLCKLAKGNFHQKQKFVAILALLAGSVVYRVIDAIVDKILCWLLNMTTMNSMDEFFMNYRAEKPPNVVGVHCLDNYNYESMKNYFIDRVGGTPRGKTKIVSVWGKHYFKNLSDKEWKN